MVGNSIKSFSDQPIKACSAGIDHLLSQMI
jgi:hypothetical protein